MKKLLLPALALAAVLLLGVNARGTSSLFTDTEGPEEVQISLALDFSCEQGCIPQCADCPISFQFNCTPICASKTIWFSSAFQVEEGAPATDFTINFHDSEITFSANSQDYTLPVPDATITFSTSATQATTTFNTGTNTWETTVPHDLAGNIFLDGLAFTVPTGGLPGNIKPVNWAGCFTSDAPNLTVKWKWAAAVYTQFNTDYNQLGVKPCDAKYYPAYPSYASQYHNLDKAGTPENYKSFVIGGATGIGWGEYKYTGTYSGWKECPVGSCGEEEPPPECDCGDPCGDHQIELISISEDGLTWTYRVTSGSSPSLSHWIMEWSCCDKIDAIYEDYEDDDEGPIEIDEGDGWECGCFSYCGHPNMCGIKFDNGYDDGETRIITIVLKENENCTYTEECVNVVTKAGRDDVGYCQVCGPVCECEEHSCGCDWDGWDWNGHDWHDWNWDDWDGHDWNWDGWNWHGWGESGWNWHNSCGCGGGGLFGASTTGGSAPLETVEVTEQSASLVISNSQIEMTADGETDCSVSLQNSGEVDITIDRLVISWADDGTTRLANLYLGDDSESQELVSGAEWDVSDTTLSPGEVQDLELILANSQPGETITIDFIMSDGTMTTTTLPQPEETSQEGGDGQ